MKKIIIIFGAVIIFSLVLALIFWMGEDQGLNKIAEKVQKARVEGSPITKNLAELLTLKEEEYPKYNDRMVIGETLKPLKEIPKKIEFINSLDQNWDKKTISYLNASSDYDRKILITKKGGIIGLNKKFGLYLERATVSFIQRDGSRGSFEALINSENGAIEMVISKNINEGIQEPEAVVKTPDSTTNPFANPVTAKELQDFNEGNVEEIMENLNSEQMADFSPEEYEETVLQEALKNKEQNSDKNFKKYVEGLKRQISTKSE